MAASPSPLRIGSACIVAFPHHWQAKNDRVIFQVETWFMFHYWMRRGLASTSPRKPKGVTRGRPPHGRVFMRPFARPLRRAIFATSALSMIAFARSEEHTSELQSLMRISYAVFRLKHNTSTQPT